MSRLQVLSFPDQKSAETALRRPSSRARTGSVAVIGAAIVARDESGEVQVTRATPASENLDAVPASSAILGLVLGAIVAVPVAGLVVGGAVGLVFSKMRNAKGEPDENYISSRACSREPGCMVMQLDDARRARAVATAREARRHRSGRGRTQRRRRARAARGDARHRATKRTKRSHRSAPLRAKVES